MTGQNLKVYSLDEEGEIYDGNKDGIIYLIQPSEFLGKKVYKIGMSRKQHINRVRTGYGKLTVWHEISEVTDALSAENKLKQIFNLKFERYQGYEYFKGDLFDMKEEYRNVVDSYIIEDRIVIDIKDEQQLEIIPSITAKMKYENVIWPTNITLREFVPFCENTLSITLDCDKDIKNINEDCVIYKCFNCPYTTNDYRNFKRHKNKKNPCTKCKFICENCQKRFMYTKSLKLHHKKCTAKKEILSETTENKALVKGSKIYNFGEEDISYLKNENFVKFILEDPIFCVENMIYNIHFHSKHPENHNITIPDEHPNSIIILRNGVLAFENRRKIIWSEIINKCNLQLQHLLTKYMDKIQDINKLTNIQNILADNSIKRNTNLYKNVETFIINQQKKYDYSTWV